MALDVKVGTFTKTTTGAPTTQAVTGVGFVPKVLFLFSQGLTSLNAFSSQNRTMMGFSTGPTASISFCASASQGATTYQSRQASTLLDQVDPAGTLVWSCTLQSFDADGFTMAFSTNNASAENVSYLALGGGDITNSGVGSFTTSAGTGNQGVTGVGFLPGLVLTRRGFNGSMGSNANNTNRNSFGAFTTTAQASLHNVGLFGGTTSTTRYQRNDALVIGTSGPGVESQRCTYVSMDSDGFTINSNPAAAMRILYLALAGFNFKVGTFAKSTGGGPAVQAITGLGFQPKALIFFSANDATINTMALENRFSYGFATAAATAAMVAQDRDAQATTSTNRIHRNDRCIIKVNNNTPAQDANASLTSMDADGFTLTWNTNDAVATNIGYIAFGEVPSGSGHPALLTTPGFIPFLADKRF